MNELSLMCYVRHPFNAYSSQEFESLINILCRKTFGTWRSDESVNLVFDEQSDDVSGRHFAVAARVFRHEAATQPKPVDEYNKQILE